MELEQSLFQSIFCRFYEVLAQVIMVVMMLVVLLAIGTIDIDRVSLPIMIGGPFLLTFLYVFVLVMFEPRPHKKIVFNDLGFDVYTFGHKRTVEWSQYVAFNITNWPPYQFIIRIKDEDDIKFSYYAFSKDQRQIIKTYLTDNIQQK